MIGTAIIGTIRDTVNAAKEVIMPMAFMEGPSIEFKRTWTDGAKRSAVAFANTDGGVIYLGVDDDGTAVGLDNLDETMRRVTQAVSDGVRPDVMSFVSVEPETVQGVPVVAVHVQRGSNRPYYLADKGIRPAGVYIRSGAASIPASESAIVDMIRQTAGDSFEDALSLEQDLTFAAARNAFADAGIEFTESSQRTLGLLDADGTYTNLAWLLSDQCTASVKAAVFADDRKEVFVNRQEFSGSLLTQFDQVGEFIARHNAVQSHTGQSMRRVDEYEYSPLVLREVLLNLLVHRDYGLSGPSLISIFDDRMEFLNLGGLPDRFTREDMMNGISSQRNPKLANVFYRLRLVEAYGTGVRRIMGDYRNDPVKPEFDISDHSFRLTLPNHRYSRLLSEEDETASGTKAKSGTGRSESGRSESKSKASAAAAPTATAPDDGAGAAERRRVVLDYVRGNGIVTRRNVQELTGLSQSAAATLVRGMVERGMLTRDGRGPSTRYRLPPAGA